MKRVIEYWVYGLEIINGGKPYIKENEMEVSLSVVYIKFWLCDRKENIE
jgi:hypothetical protein